MIPPCDPAVLDNNPQFKRLHQHLTNNLLNPDGTTRADDNDRTRRAVAEELRACRIRHAKKQILKRATRQIALDSRSSLPDELRDTVAIISLFLESQTPLNELDNDSSGDDGNQSLLDQDINDFRSSIRTLIPHLSDLLSLNLDSLRAIADAVTNSGSASSSSDVPFANQSRSRARARVSEPSLSSQLSDRQRRLRTLQISELPASRRQMAVTAAAVMAARAEVMEHIVVLLERTKHGALSRASKAQAEHLATVAEGMEGKTRVMKLETLATIYTPETVAALNNYREHLRETRLRLEEKQKIATQALEAYEAADLGQKNGDGASTDEGAASRMSRGGKATSGAMVDIARRYGALVKEVETIKMEMKRLGG
ncbi:hypothetical protein VTN96DRAFT_10339 [Rasamsonia emersonii]